jgi:hypothetical protein
MYNLLHRLPTKTSPQRRTVSLSLDKQRRAITLEEKEEEEEELEEEETARHPRLLLLNRRRRNGDALPSSRARRRRVVIDAVNVTPSSPGISPRPIVVIITRSSSIHATPDVPWFGPVLLRLVQRHERSKERDEDIKNSPKEVREYRRSKKRSRPCRRSRGRDVLLFASFRSRCWWCCHLRSSNSRTKQAQSPKMKDFLRDDFVKRRKRDSTKKRFSGG